jgi:hypothetical protein
MKMLRTFTRLLAIAAVAAASSASLLAQLPPPTPAGGGFLFVTFKNGQDVMAEQIYFNLSRDGRNWTTLNDGKPVLVSDVGEKGVRDSCLVRSQDGKQFCLIATDLSWARDRSVSRATHAGSRSIVIWESNDLVHWSAPRLAQIAPDDAGCVWAPEAIFDPETNDYLVFWASTTKRDNFAKFRIWATHTRDFKTFSPPFIYIDKPATIIDATITYDGHDYYRFIKDEKVKAVTMETSPKLSGPWKEIPSFSLARLFGHEGPECYLVEPASVGKPATWCLILDYYAKGLGYQPFVTHDLASGQFTPGEGFTFPYPFRHGSVIPISNAEYQRLEAAYPNTGTNTPAPAK